MGFLRKMDGIITPWEACILLAIAYTLFDIPLEAAFHHPPTRAELLLDLCISALFTWDVMQYGHRGEILKFRKTWNTINVVSCLPLMVIAAAIYGRDNNWLIYLQVFRLTRGYGIINLIIERSKTKLVPKRFKFLAAGIITLTMINIFACGWLIIYPPGADPLTDYNKAIYWLITTIATVGYGDITPSTNGGRVYAMGIMILGATIWGILIASASRMMLASDRRKEKKKEKMEALHSFFNHYEVPKQLQDQVVGFFNHLWSRKMSEDEHAVLSELPTALQAELHTFMNLKPISRVSLFRGVSFECLSGAAKKLEQAFYAPGERIINKGETGEEMYLIGHGTVVVHAGDQYITTLGEGSCFGEMALIGDGQRTSDVTASSYCDVFKLSREKFDELYKSHADLRQNIEKIAHERKNRPSGVPQTVGPSKLAG
jgi:voltage-gated potassium channel